MHERHDLLGLKDVIWSSWLSSGHEIPCKAVDDRLLVQRVSQTLKLYHGVYQVIPGFRISCCIIRSVGKVKNSQEERKGSNWDVLKWILLFRDKLGTSISNLILLISEFSIRPGDSVNCSKLEFDATGSP